MDLHCRVDILGEKRDKEAKQINVLYTLLGGDKYNEKTKSGSGIEQECMEYYVWSNFKYNYWG